MTSPDSDLSIRSAAGAVEFFIHVTPRARRTRVGGAHGGALRVRVTAAPAGGAANEACARALADALAVRRGAVDLDAGSKGRRKRVRVRGEPDRLARRLAALAGHGASD